MKRSQEPQGKHLHETKKKTAKGETQVLFFEEVSAVKLRDKERNMVWFTSREREVGRKTITGTPVGGDGRVEGKKWRNKMKRRERSKR